MKNTTIIISHIALIHEIMKSYNAGNEVDVANLDFSKAFDTF